MVRRVSRFLVFLLCGLMTGCDHVTKHMASSLLADQAPVKLIPGVFDLRYTENHDIAFSLLSPFGHAYKSSMLPGLAIAVLLFVAVSWWRRRRGSLLEQAGFAMIVGGALGNVTDRLVRGYVVDFMHLTYWPVFNVADVAIVVGVALLLLTAVRASPARAV